MNTVIDSVLTENSKRWFILHPLELALWDRVGWLFAWTWSWPEVFNELLFLSSSKLKWTAMKRVNGLIVGRGRLTVRHWALCWLPFVLYETLNDQALFTSLVWERTLTWRLALTLVVIQTQTEPKLNARWPIAEGCGCTGHNNKALWGLIIRCFSSRLSETTMSINSVIKQCLILF